MQKDRSDAGGRDDALDRLRSSIDALAVEARSLRDFREGVLATLGAVVTFEAAIFHALSPRVSLETGAFVGFDRDAVAKHLSKWDDFAVELGALRAIANERLVATDRDAFAPGSRARARYEARFVSLFGAPSVCVAHLIVRGSLRGAIVLFSRTRGGFSSRSVSALRSVIRAIAVADALHESLDGAARATTPVRRACRDERLTERQRAIVELVAMGQSNEDIAKALEISPNTARNHLARIMARVGAANRAELVSLAVFA